MDDKQNVNHSGQITPIVGDSHTVIYVCQMRQGRTGLNKNSFLLTLCTYIDSQNLVVRIDS